MILPRHACLFLFCLLATPSHAQNARGAQPRKVVIPDTYDTDPAADPARPTVTNPAHIPPPGYLQFEQGFLQAGTTPGGGPDSQFSLVQTTKLSVNHYVMPFFQSQPFARSSTSGQSSNDPGDLDLGIQFVLLDEGEGHSRVPTVAVAYIQRVRSGSSPNLDVGEYNRSALLLASGDLPLGIHFDANVLFNEQPGAITTPIPKGTLPTGAMHDVRRMQAGQTFSATHNLTSRLSFSGEIWRFSLPFAQGNAIGNLYALGYTINKRLVLDAGFNRGLTGSSTHWESFAGFTYLLPHRLWPLKQAHT